MKYEFIPTQLYSIIEFRNYFFVISWQLFLTLNKFFANPFIQCQKNRKMQLSLTMPKTVKVRLLEKCLIGAVMHETVVCVFVSNACSNKNKTIMFRF